MKNEKKFWEKIRLNCFYEPKTAIPNMLVLHNEDIGQKIRDHRKNKQKFEDLIKLQKEANLAPLNVFGDFDFWIEDTTQEQFDALIKDQTDYANEWIKYFKENNLPFKG